MTNKLMEDKKAEFFDTIIAVNNLTENEATWWWQWIEKLVEEVEKEGRKVRLGEVLSVVNGVEDSKFNLLKKQPTNE